MNNMQDDLSQDEIALIDAVTKARSMTDVQKLKRRREISATIKELKMSVLELMEELEAIEHIGNSLFRVDDVAISDGVMSAKVEIDLGLVLDWYQSVPSPTAGVMPFLAEQAIVDVLEKYDFGSAAKVGDEIVVIDTTTGDLVACGAVVENNQKESFMAIRVDDEVKTYSADNYAFRYERLFFGASDAE